MLASLTPSLRTRLAKLPILRMMIVIWGTCDACADPDSSLEASNTEAVHCSMVEDGGTGEVSVHLVTQPHGISSEGHVTSADPVHIIADRVPEDPSASGSKTTLKSNQVSCEVVLGLYLFHYFAFCWIMMIAITWLGMFSLRIMGCWRWLFDESYPMMTVLMSEEYCV